MNTLGPKTVLMTADTIGGVWTYAMELARQFEKRGVNIALATMGSPLAKHQAAEASRLGNLQVYESSFKLEWMESPWDDVDAAADWLLSIEDLLKPDIVHLNGYVHGALPWKSPTVIVAHSCVASWWQAVKGEQLPPVWRDYRERVAVGLAAADQIVAPTHAMLCAIDENYGSCGSSRVIKNGREPMDFYGGSKQDIVFSAGRLWDDAKNIQLLDRIAPSLEWLVYIAGDQEVGDGMAPNSADFCKCRLLGKLPSTELASWYSRASIYALPARYEPFGLTALEAALSGCALVLGDIPSLRELWQDSAVFVSPDDEDELREAIRGLIADPAALNDLAKRGRGRAQTFSSKKMAEEYLELYAELMVQKGTTARRVEEMACV